MLVGAVAIGKTIAEAISFLEKPIEVTHTHSAKRFPIGTLEGKRWVRIPRVVPADGALLRQEALADIHPAIPPPSSPPILPFIHPPILFIIHPSFLSSTLLVIRPSILPSSDPSSRNIITTIGTIHPFTNKVVVVKRQ